ncbi:MAG: 6-bladed beta-propeller [Bacteroidales bacterium]
MKHFITLLFCLLVLSCSNPSNSKKSGKSTLNSLDVESSIGKGRIVNISEISTDIKYVPLETNKNSLIGKGALVFYENDRIYVKFSKIVKVFNSDGKYLFTFNRIGRGPQEYTDGGIIEIEKRTGNFNVQTVRRNTTSLKRYNRDGIFINEININSPSGESLSRVQQISDSLFLMRISNRIIKNDIEYFALVIDNLSNIREMIPLPEVKEKKSNETISVGNRVINFQTSNTQRPIHLYNDSLRFYNQLDEAIYSYDSEKGSFPRFHIDYGKFRSSDAISSSLSGSPGKHISVSTLYFIESDNFLILYFHLGDYAHEPFTGRRWFTFDRVVERRDAYGLFNKKTGDFTLLNHPVKGVPGFRDDILQGPPFVIHSLSGDNTGVQMILSSDFKEYLSQHKTSAQLKKIADSLNDEDNPVIVLVKLR